MGNIATKIKDLREENKLKQKELADLLSTTDDSIYSWEKGRSEPPIEQIKNLAKVFNVSTDYLLGVEESDSLICNKGIGSFRSGRTGGEINLSPEEIKFIQDYRKLGPFQQETLRIQIEALAEKKNRPESDGRFIKKK